jgi:mercuric ion transport protein
MHPRTHDDQPRKSSYRCAALARVDGGGRPVGSARGFILLHLAARLMFGLGISGAWIGNFTRLAPYQPCVIAATIAFLGCGYWLVNRSSKLACVDGEVCARQLPNRLVKTGLIVATILVVAALGFNFVAPLFLDS